VTSVGSRDKAGHHSGGVLRERNFRSFWFGETVSEAGNRVASVAVPLVAVAYLRVNTFTVSLLTTLQYLPWLLISLPAGAWLDRMPRRKVMIGCDILAAILYLSIPAAAWGHVLTAAQLLGVVFLTGSLAVVFSTAYRAQLPDLLPPSALVAGNATMQASASATSFVGPSLGGYLAEALGAADALVADALSFLVSAACLLSIRGVPDVAVSVTKRPERGSIRQGIRFLIHDPYLRPMTLWAAIINLGLTGYSALIMVFLVRVAGLRPALIGLLLASTAIGAVVGSLIAKRLGKRFGTARTYLLGAFVSTPFLLLIPFTRPGAGIAFFTAGWLVSGFGIAVTNAFSSSFRLAHTPAEMRARVSATAGFILNGTYPVGALAGGLLGTWFGVRTGLWLMLGIAVLGTGCLLTRPLWQSRDLPGLPSQPISS
jgi:MFS family permease